MKHMLQGQSGYLLHQRTKQKDYCHCLKSGLSWSIENVKEDEVDVFVEILTGILMMNKQHLHRLYKQVKIHLPGNIHLHHRHGHLHHDLFLGNIRQVIQKECNYSK